MIPTATRPRLPVLSALAALLLGAAAASAQYVLPQAEYLGSLRVKVACELEGNGKFKVKGPVSIDDQVGDQFLASAEFTGKRGGLDCSVDFQMLCSVDDFGVFTGEYEAEIECTDGVTTTTSMGSGDVTGRYVPGRLAFALEGTDDAGGDDVCAVQAIFKGKGSPGQALCAALNERAIGKLGKRFYKAWSQRILFANVPASVQVLQDAILKAEAAMSKASVKIGKKTEKAGGTCKVAAVSPTGITTTLRNDTILPPYLLTAFDPSRFIDRLVRSDIAKLQGAYFAARLKAEARFTMKLDPVKRAKALTKAREKFVAATTKILVKATNTGNYTWTAPGPQQLAFGIEGVTDALVAFLE